MYRLAWFESPNTRTANVIRRHPYQCGAAWNYVTARFFDVFKIPIVRGRGFTERDNAAGPPVVVINQALARKFWKKDENPVGHRLIIGSGMGPGFTQPPREIVGIAGDARDGGLNNALNRRRSFRWRR
jgi:hypothetical protein